MQKSWVRGLIVALLTVSASQAMLSPGDIAIVMANSDAPDSFAWVPFVDIPAGLVISFTDSSYGSGDSGGITNTNFRWTEHLNAGGPLSWQHTAILPAGTVVIFDGTSWNIGTGTGAAMNLSTSGDQIFAFVGGVASNPVPGTYSGIITGLLYGVQFSSTVAAWLTSGAGTTTDSYLPPMLAGANVALGADDNWIYNGPLSGTPEELRAAINNPANWRSDNATAFSWNRGNFDVVPEPGTIALVACGAAMLALSRRRIGARR